MIWMYDKRERCLRRTMDGVGMREGTGWGGGVVAVYVHARSGSVRVS